MDGISYFPMPFFVSAGNSLSNKPAKNNKNLATHITDPSLTLVTDFL